MADPQRPLEGIRIADFSWVLAGPRATEYLGAMGAEVIKIEGPRRPDQFRNQPTVPGGVDLYRPVYWSLNYSKQACTIDFTLPEGRELALKLIAISDVVIENYAYGVMEKADLTYNDLRKVKPDIIMVSGSALGKTGPSKHHVTYGALLHAYTGINSVIGYEGEPHGTLGGTFSDPLTGATLVMAVLAGLWHRKRTGEGQFIDCSMAETTIAQIPEFFLDYSVNGRLNAPMGNREHGCSPYNCYPCQGANGWIAIGVRDEAEWQAFCEVIGEPEWCHDRRFRDGFGRWQHREELDRLVADWTREQDGFEAARKLQAAGVPATATYNSGNIVEDEHLKQRRILVELESALLGRKPILRLPWLTDGRDDGYYAPAPTLGQDNDHVFHDLLGLSDTEVEALREKGVVL